MARRLLFSLLALLFVLAGVWLGGLIWFANTIPGESADGDPQHTDAIVVLTGGSERLTEGVRLLAEAKADKLFVSGVHEGVALDDILRAQGLRSNERECCIVLGYAASDTFGNARETAIWMEQEGFHSLRLVTANYHMRRSLVEFRDAMPDVTIVPHPVEPDVIAVSPWWMNRRTAYLFAGEYNKYLAALLRVWLADNP